jgi:hypothetical protein
MPGRLVLLSKLRPKLTYANVVSTLCLFILLGGSSYAAIRLGKNAVKGANIAKNAVTSPKVRDRSLLAKDFKAGQLPRGPAGAKGDPGQTGTAGQSGATNVTVRSNTETGDTFADGTGANMHVDCQPGERATGGGHEGSPGLYVAYSKPFPQTGTPTGWRVRFWNDTGASVGPTDITVYAICSAP